jgi:uncharacterized repeat protein (TIGR01451 family)
LATLPAVAAMAFALGLVGPAWGAGSVSFPEFEKCLQENGLTAVPDDQPSDAVQVCKTVRVTKVTVYSWALAKTPAPPTLRLAEAQTGPLALTLTATPTPTVTWVVDGEIVVRNVGSEDVTVLRVVDDLTLPEGTKMTDVISATPFVLNRLPSAASPEEMLRYSFTIPADMARATQTAASNTASVDWAVGAKDPTTTITTPVSFEDGPKTPQAIYFRTATVTDSPDPAPPGTAVGPPAPSGPFTVAADQPDTLNPATTAQVTNTSLRCGSSATITNMAALRSDNAPERRNNPTVIRPAPLPQVVFARALVLVMSPECGPPPPMATPQSVTPAPPPPPTGLPAVNPAGIPTPVPAKPAAPAPCPVPKLATSVLGPKRAFAGQRATWLVTVRNGGPAAARSVLVQERLPVGFSVVGSTRAFTFRGRLLRFRVPRLNAGRRLAIRITMHVDNGLAAGRAVHRVRVSASCARAETALAPVMVTPGIAPAVTG